MNVVELKKMAIDTALSNLKNELHYIIDRIAADKAFDQYNAKCGEADRLEAENERLREAAERALHILQYCPDKQEKAVALLSAALQPKEGE